MKLTILSYNAVASWKWDTSSEPHQIHRYSDSPNDGMNDLDEGFGNAQGDDDDDDDDEVCGICQSAFESCCPICKVPGDDCPLSTSQLPIV
jgi:anaphase-promoting complex subunit 11